VAEPAVAVILVAAGSSRRMGGGEPKAYAELGGRPVLAWSLATLQRWPRTGPVVVVTRAEDGPRARALLAEWLPGHATAVVAGGAERRDSVAAGLRALADHAAEVVLVHDAARPLASVALFERVARAAERAGGAVPGTPVADTLRRREGAGFVTVAREGLHAIQTPQGFRRDLLERAHAQGADPLATDDAVLVEALGVRVELVEGEPGNRKITHPADLELLRRLVAGGTGGAPGGGDMRCGIGHDLHRLRAGGPLRLGGVDVPGEVEAVGHSDGDALLHAITDAVLGALALGDIGEHFSDQDPAHRGRDSAGMLQHAIDLARARGYRVVQVDATVHLERPRLAAHRGAMRERIAALLGIPVADVSVKAKTGEGLGPVGEGRAVAGEAMVQLRPLA